MSDSNPEGPTPRTLTKEEDIIQEVKTWDESTNPVDLRAEVKHDSAHLQFSVCIPFDDLLDRMGEMPPKGATVQLISDDPKQLAEARDLLLSRGYQTQISILWDNALVPALQQANLLGDITRFRPLWTASPCLSESIDTIENTLIAEGIVTDLGEARAVDLACGCGRDVVFLAMRNWGRVVGIDYLSSQLERTRQLAKNNRITDEKQIEVVERDLEKDGLPLHGEKYHLITVARYLHRPHFEQLRELLVPGGFLVYHTFMKGCENTTIGRPRRPQFLLSENELGSTFNSDSGFSIVTDEVKLISDGRPTSFFVAQKLPES